jgi:surfactin synthase thioesterase subunit
MNCTLFCFPFAGGSCYSYRAYSKLAPSRLNIIPFDLPGRGMRSGESLLKNAETIVDDLYLRIKPQLNNRYAFYGHSMGTVLAYLLTKRILKEALPKPCYLFMSGRGGPSIPEKETPVYTLPKDQFFSKIREMDGVPDAVIENAELMNFFEPVLRADFEALETYRYQETEPFDIPILVMVGDEEKITVADALAWKKESVSSVEVQWLKGKHFFIYHHAEAIIKSISGKLLR